MEDIQRRTEALEERTYHVTNGTISNDILEIRWPLGVPAPSIPETRHDILIWHMLNRTHIFLPSDDYNVQPLSLIESQDLERVLEITQRYASQRLPSHLEFHSIHTIYRRFDPVRGLDYGIHFNYLDRTTQPPSMLLKSFQVVKPLGRVEIIPSPYVTESTRIALLVPIFEDHAQSSIKFIGHYERICMSNQDNTILLLVSLRNVNVLHSIY